MKNQLEPRENRIRRSSARRSTTRAVALAVALLALTLFVAACGEAGEEATTDSTLASSTATSPPETSPLIAASGLPKLVDLGSDSCIPCQMMAPELEALAQEYAGSVDVVVVDVNNTEEGAALAGELRIRVIPTQIWFDPEGGELGRHEGFLSKDDIVGLFGQFGYPLVKADIPPGQGTETSDDGG